MIITIDLASNRPLYSQIVDGIRAALVAGEVQPGDRLPAGRDLAEALDVNLETVQRAYRRLSDDGIVVSRVGRGTRVSETLDVNAIGLNGLIDELADQGRRLGLSADELLAAVRKRLNNTS